VRETNLADKLRLQADRHPLDTDLGMFYTAATRIQALEGALILVTDANSSWAMPLDDKDVDAINAMIKSAQAI
jgi:hypothetical protein